MKLLFNTRNSFILLIVMILFLLMKQDGLIDLYKINLSNEKLSFEFNKLSNELRYLKEENHLLKNDKHYIEKVARENYFFSYPNETIIHY